MPRVKTDFGSQDQHLPEAGFCRQKTCPITATDLSGSCPLTPPVPDLSSSTIHIWQFPVAIPESELIAFAEILSGEERARASRFHFEKDARRFTVARATLRSILAGYTRMPAREISFLYSEHGKPKSRRSSNPVSVQERAVLKRVSHSGGLAMVAVARRAQSRRGY